MYSLRMLAYSRVVFDYLGGAMDLCVRQSAEFGAPYASCCVGLGAKPHPSTIDEGVCHHFPRTVQEVLNIAPLHRLGLHFQFHPARFSGIVLAKIASNISPIICQV